jgi:hypothetical protein
MQARWAGRFAARVHFSELPCTEAGPPEPGNQWLDSRTPCTTFKIKADGLLPIRLTFHTSDDELAGEKQATTTLSSWWTSGAQQKSDGQG